MRSSKKYIIGLIVFFSIVIAIYLPLTLHIAQQATKDTKVKSDAILVLGARSYIDGKYNPCMKARVEHAVDLYKHKYASKIIMTGGNDIEDNVNEAETMQKIAIERGVKQSDILLEKQATSTYENFTLSQELLKKNHLISVIIVTEPFHIARASLIAKKLGYDFTVSPATNSPCWSPNHYLTKYFLKEPVAIMQYSLKGRL